MPYHYIGYDKSVRILSTKTRTELAKLAHNMQVTAVAWMDRDAGVVTLGDNGIVSTWTRSVSVFNRRRQLGVILTSLIL